MNDHGKFILCVDDDSDDLFFLEEAIRLVEPSMEIVQCHDGKEALASLRRAKTLRDLPCVVVLDINMPKMDGKETLRQIKADPALCGVQVVALTTSATRADREYFEGLGVRMFTKPVNHGELKDIAEIFLQHCK